MTGSGGANPGEQGYRESKLLVRGRRRWRALWHDPLFWLFLGLTALYLLLVNARPQGVFWSLDEGGKLLYMQNVLQSGDPGGPLRYPGRALDPNLDYVPLFFWHRLGDQIYSWWPVAFPLITLPFYAMIGWLGLYLLPALSGALGAVLTGALARHMLPTARAAPVVVALITGLATPLVFYSTMFWEHTPSVALALLALWLLTVGERTGKIRYLVVAGVAGSLATLLRTEQGFIVLGVVLLLLLRNWRWALTISLAFITTTLFWAAINIRLMGNPLSLQWEPSSMSLSGGILVGVREAGLWYLPYLLFGPPRIVAFDLRPGVLATATLLALGCLALPFVRRATPVLLAVYVAVSLVCGSVLFAPWGYRSVHGFVLIAPHVLFAVWLLVGRRGLRHTLLPQVLLTSGGLFLLAYVLRSWVAAGGLQWGPRYMLVLYPLAVLASVIGLWLYAPRLSRRLQIGLWLLYGVTVVIGVGFEIRGEQSAGQTVGYYRDTQQALLVAEERPMLTACTWLPMVIPELYWRGDIYAQNEGAPAEWPANVQAHGYAQAYWLTMDLCLLEPLTTIAELRAGNPTGIAVEPLPFDNQSREDHNSPVLEEQ